jgi:ATP-binding cassette, subfamily B, bacterial
LWPSFRPYRVQTLLIAGGVLLEMAFSAAFPLSLKVLIDNALIGRNYHLLRIILAVLGVGVVIVSLAGLGRDYLYARVSSSALGNLRFVMFNHLQWLSMDFFAWARGGAILARFSGDLATVESVLAMILPWGVLPSLDVLANCVILFALDYWQTSTRSIPESSEMPCA